MRFQIVNLARSTTFVLAGLALLGANRMAAGGIFTEALQAEVRLAYSFDQGPQAVILQSHEAGIDVSATASTGATARFIADVHTFFGPGAHGVEFEAGGLLELSGDGSVRPTFAAMGYSGRSIAHYDYRLDANSHVSNYAEFKFHGHLAPGDSLFYRAHARFHSVVSPFNIAPAGPVDEYNFEEIIGSGDFSRSIIVPLHDFDLDETPDFFRRLDSMVFSSLSFQINKTGAGTSWVMLDDPGASSFAPTNAEVPEPASLLAWSVLGLAGLTFQRLRRRQNQP